MSKTTTNMESCKKYILRKRKKRKPKPRHNPL